GSAVAVGVHERREITAEIEDVQRAVLLGDGPLGGRRVKGERGQLVERRSEIVVSGQAVEGVEQRAAVAFPVLNRPAAKILNAFFKVAAPAVTENTGLFGRVHQRPQAIPGTGERDSTAEARNGVIGLGNICIPVEKVDGRTAAGAVAGGTRAVRIVLGRLTGGASTEDGEVESCQGVGKPDSDST